MGGGLKDIVEDYDYDDLHRLVDVSQGSTTTLAMTYDALSNINTKRAYTSSGSSDSNANVSGTYGYTSGTHRLTSAGGSSYGYDGNGSMISGDGRVLG